MKYQYKRIDTRTVKGLKQAENLKAKGWRIILVGIDYILFEK
jgi:hypothetical protein